jgi:chemotaxis response regulator CheB
MRIAIVNDVSMAVEAVRRVIVTGSSHVIAWTAADGHEAVRRCVADPPDLILMDLIARDGWSGSNPPHHGPVSVRNRGGHR